VKVELFKNQMLATLPNYTAKVKRFKNTVINGEVIGAYPIEIRSPDRKWVAEVLITLANLETKDYAAAAGRIVQNAFRLKGVYV